MCCSKLSYLPEYTPLIGVSTQCYCLNNCIDVASNFNLVNGQNYMNFESCLQLLKVIRIVWFVWLSFFVCHVSCIRWVCLSEVNVTCLWLLEGWLLLLYLLNIVLLSLLFRIIKSIEFIYLNFDHSCDLLSVAKSQHLQNLIWLTTWFSQKHNVIWGFEILDY